MALRFGDIGVALQGHVALLEICRPPHNFFDIPLINDIAAALETLDKDPECRAVVLASKGKSFCAGADFCLLYTSPSPRDATLSRMPSSA